MIDSPSIPHDIQAKPDTITYYPRYQKAEEREPADISFYESLLRDWFGCPVILMASGRSSLHLFLQARGFHRYRHKLQIPPYLSRCVINALTPSIFPVEPPAKGHGVLFYHQYGFPQRYKPRNTVVIEDIAHAFFASPRTGVRQWAGEAAIFSLPKFFAIAGMAGGLVAYNPDIAEKIRETINKAPPDPAGIREWMRHVIASAYDCDSSVPDVRFVNSAYELLLEFFCPDAFDLVGFPRSIDEICRIGEERLKRVNFFRSFFDKRAVPADFWGVEENILPFALPYFGKGSSAALERINKALSKQGIAAGIYHVDVNRNMFRPKYRTCILLPCHQEIPMPVFESICRTVLDNDR